LRTSGRKGKGEKKENPKRREKRKEGRKGFPREVSKVTLAPLFVAPFRAGEERGNVQTPDRSVVGGAEIRGKEKREGEGKGASKVFPVRSLEHLVNFQKREGGGKKRGGNQKKKR